MNLEEIFKKIKLKFLYSFNFVNLKKSRLVLVLGVAFAIIFIGSIYYVNPNLDIFINPHSYIFNIGSLVFAYFSILIAMAALFNSSEMTIYGIKYEKSKQSSIRLFNIIKYTAPFFSPTVKFKYLNYILNDNFNDKEFEKYLSKSKNVPMRINGLVEKEMNFLDDLIIFKRDYEVYYLPGKLLWELRYFLYNKHDELSTEDISEVLDIIRKYVRNEFEIKL